MEVEDFRGEFCKTIPIRRCGVQATEYTFRVSFQNGRYIIRLLLDGILSQEYTVEEKRFIESCKEYMIQQEIKCGNIMYSGE